MAKLTPMMEQYFEIKNKYKYCLLFFRLGDFYELFYEDAIIAAKELEITLTGKDCGQKERAPMCGVPFHSADTYIARLVEKGYKVAVCEQTEDPKKAKGLVKRSVIRVITPGTITDNNILDDKKNNYIMCIYCNKNGYGIAVCDVTTGEFQTSEFVSVNALSKLADEIARFNPAEVICCKEFIPAQKNYNIENKFNLKLNVCDDWQFEYSTCEKKICSHFKVHSLEGLGLKNKVFSVCASGSLLQYLYDTQKNDLSHILSVKNYSSNDYMIIDASTRRNLELSETLREKSKKGSLLWVLDKTKTSMGARLLRKWIEQPLINSSDINKRLFGIEELKNEIFIREEIKEVLSSMYDFERIMSKIIYQTANCRDLISLKNSLENLPLLKEIIRKCNSPILKEIYEKLDTLNDIFELINKSINDDPPFTLREGGLIKYGFNDELDILLRAKSEGSKWVAELEVEEREKTGIKNLKIKYNKVFGYYIEVTNSYLNEVPERYIRKQTLSNCERYITTELNKLAELILGAEEKIINLEYNLFCDIRNSIAGEVERIQLAAHLTSFIDVLQSLSEVAQNNNYVKPVVNSSGIINIVDGRHPVVENMLCENFVPNDTYLDNDENSLSIITGPNMAGKSTYMRQTALIVLMAQMGSFVPAKKAEIGIVDRIFTRVGASDDLASGQSTFMVEMSEVANILNNATKDSLLILDEIGRGTSTFDGLSIAWSVLEHIADKKSLGAKTLFATHYHELTELEGKIHGVKNYCISVQENGEDIVFLRKILRGGADHSYGVQVARLAGLPNKVIKRSNEILKQLNAADIAKKTKKIAKESKENIENCGEQINIFYNNEFKIFDEIKNIDVMSLSPIEALQTLFDLQKKINGL